MLFNTFSFWLFFGVVFLLYGMFSHRWQNRLLLVASYLFYGLWEPKFLCLIALTTVIDFYIGLKIDSSEDPAVRKRWLTISIVMNLAVLGTFKYCNFFIHSAQALAAKLGFHAAPWTLAIALPPAISFYTFHEISYTVDVYRKHVKPARSLTDFAVFIAFFPQLVMGPIGRASWQLPQFVNPRRMTWDGWCQGASLILIGLFKKLCVADVLAPIASQAFDHPASCSPGTLLFGLYCFAIQIYTDFSGYTDIARGLAKLMGFELIENFNHPYFSASITEFWRRWHISLSTWLRDYLYIPLGGNRNGEFNTYRNLFLTMFLGGLWHGASWTFVIWGSLHGIYLAAHKFILGAPASRRLSSNPPDCAATQRVAEHAGGTPALQAAELAAVPDVSSIETPPKESFSDIVRYLVKVFFTFHLVCLTWIFFQPNFSNAWAYLTGLWPFGALTPHGPGTISFSADTMTLAISSIAALIFLVDIPQYARRDHCAMLRWPFALRVAGFVILTMWLIMTRETENVPFIYFKF